MNKEVELILKKLKIVSEEQERGLYLCDKEHSKVLLDYITNLQQENERLRNHIQMIPYLQTVREKDDYKSRIEKAVEYLKKPRGNYYRDLHYEPIKVITLINILNGRSDE